jgi:hypothetical protein
MVHHVSGDCRPPNQSTKESDQLEWVGVQGEGGGKAVTVGGILFDFVNMLVATLASESLMSWLAMNLILYGSSHYKYMNEMPAR